MGSFGKNVVKRYFHLQRNYATNCSKLAEKKVLHHIIRNSTGWNNDTHISLSGVGQIWRIENFVAPKIFVERKMGDFTDRQIISDADI